MSLFLFVCAIAAVNLGLGYALAVQMGLGPSSLGSLWDALERRGQAPPPIPIPIPSEAELTRSLTEELAAASSEQVFEEELNEQLDAELSIEPYDDALGSNESEMLDADAPENWDLNEKYVETSILKLNIAMIKSGMRAAQIDSRLRACRGRSDGETIRGCLAELVEDCETYLVEQSEAAEKFHNRISELGELAALGEEIEMANLQQSAQIETTLSNLRHMDFDSDLEKANQRLLEELKNLRMARHALRDSQEAAFLAVARYENRLDKIERRLFNDPLTKLRNRIGLETTLWQWWQEGRHQSRQISAALYDLDGFGLINELHGIVPADRILFHVADTVLKTMGKSDLPARFAGQRFLLMLVDVGPQMAIKNSELVRQSIGRMTFRHRGEEIRVTARSGITEVKPDDTYESLVKRLEETLAKAKQAGPNRAFLHKGREPEPVESPNLGAKHVEIEI